MQLYLKEAQHYYNLKVFQCKISTKRKNQNEIDELNVSGEYYYIYGSVHIESEGCIQLQLDKETIVFTNDDENKKTIYIDIINIYNENKEGGKINDIEKYLVNPNSNCFQVFVSSEKNGKNAKIDNEKKESYLQKFVVPILNFDVKSLNYEAKKIIVSTIDDEPESFRLTPTFLNLSPTEVTYFEIDYEPNPNRDKINENEENPDLGVYSFDIKIKTFIDLYKNDD